MLKIHRSTKAKGRRNKKIDKKLDAFTSQWPHEFANGGKCIFYQQERMAYVRLNGSLNILVS
jgi:hypothetical protein